MSAATRTALALLAQKYARIFAIEIGDVVRLEMEDEDGAVWSRRLLSLPIWTLGATTWGRDRAELERKSFQCFGCGHVVATAHSLCATCAAGGTP